MHSSKISHRVSIHHPPTEVNVRSVFGYWEGDSVVGACSIGGGVHTEVERLPRMMHAVRVDALISRDGVDAQKQILGDVPPEGRQTTIMDNGTEVCLHYGGPRRYYLKGIDFTQITKQNSKQR